MGRPGQHLFREYVAALLRTPQIFKRMAFRKRTLEEELQEALLRGSLRKAFGGLDLLLLGLGIVIGSGWAYLSGSAAEQYAGMPFVILGAVFMLTNTLRKPGIIISYIISGLAALLAAACYAELCVEYPVSGGAFSYVMVTFGELAAFVALAGLLLEYALGMAALARGFSRYLALLFDLPPDQFRVEVAHIGNNTHTFDFMAAAIILIMSALLSIGVRESAVVISVVTLIKLVLLLFVSIVGYTQGHSSNLVPFLHDSLLPPFLARISPRTQTPLMAQVVFGVIIAMLALMVEVDAASAMVSFGTLVALWLVCNAQLYRRYIPETQMRFTRYGTVETAPRAQVTSWVPGRKLPLPTRKHLVIVHMVLLNCICIGLTAFYEATAPKVANLISDAQKCHERRGFAPVPPPGALEVCHPGERDRDHGWSSMWFALAWLLTTLSFQLCCPLEYEPSGWHVPWWLMPWLPSAAIGLVMFSIGGLPGREYWKIGMYFGILLFIYVVFSLPMSYIKHSKVDYVNTEELNVIELAFVNGQWQAARLPSMFPTASNAASTRASDTAAKLDLAGKGHGPGLPAAMLGRCSSDAVHVAPSGSGGAYGQPLAQYSSRLGGRALAVLPAAAEKQGT